MLASGGIRRLALFVSMSIAGLTASACDSNSTREADASQQAAQSRNALRTPALSPVASTCQDGTCEPDERCWSCPQDCGPCVEYQWSVQFDQWLRAPTLSDEGVTYILGQDVLYAVTADGQIDWQHTFDPSPTRHSPYYLSSASAVLVMDTASTFHLIGVQGTPIRSFAYAPAEGNTRLFGEHLAVSDEIIVFNPYLEGLQSDNSRLVALDLEGQTIFDVPVPDNQFTQTHPTIDAQGNITLVTDSASLEVFRFDSTGNLTWRTTLLESLPAHDRRPCCTTGPVLLSDQRVLVSTGYGRVWVLSDDGQIVWQIARNARIAHEPVVDSSARLVIGASDGHVYSVSADFQPVSRATLNEYSPNERLPIPPATAALATSSGAVLAPVADRVIGLDLSNGSRLFDFGTQDASAVVYPLTMSSDGRILVVKGRYLHSYRSELSGPAQSSWPMPRGGPSNRSWQGAIGRKGPGRP